MKKWIKLSVGLFLVSLLGLYSFRAFGLTEASMRVVLSEWMKGNAQVPNPWTELLNFVKANGVFQVNTFADLVGVTVTGLDEGSIVETRGLAAANDGGGTQYYYASTSSASTNTWGTSATSAGTGRWIIAKPLTLVQTFPWDPASCITNRSVTTNVTVTLAAAGDPVAVSHTIIGSQDSAFLAAVATNGTVRVIFYNNSGATIDVPDGTGKLVITKF